MSVPYELTHTLKLTKTSDKTPCAELFGAFDRTEKLLFTLELEREFGADSPVISIFDEDMNAVAEKPFEWIPNDYACDLYKCTLDLSELVRQTNFGLFFYYVVFDSAWGKIRCSFDEYSYSPKVQWYDDDYTPFQLTVYEIGFETPDWFKGEIMYQIFVDRFYKAGNVPVRQDAVIDNDWYNGIPQYAPYVGAPVENNVFFGGTLWGVAEKLDYLKTLGVGCIYLSPIFEAYSNHKYDTGNYMKIDDMFGGEEAFDALVSKASEKNIRIILDGVFNHTGSDSLYFNIKRRYKDGGAYNTKSSPYYGWYDFREYPDKYRSWWGIKILPAVDTSNASFNSFINGENGVVRHYLGKGISGWRLDVADELDERFIENLRNAAKSEKKDALIIGEVWEDASDKISYEKRRHYFSGNELDSVMNYPLASAIIGFINNSDAKNLFAVVHTLYSHYPKQVSDVTMNLLGTHDTERILTVLGKEGADGKSADELATAKMSDEQRAKAIEKLKLAYVLLAFLPGVPCIYYGDEAGSEGYRDPFNRKPYPWGREEQSLIEHYRSIGKIRKNEKLFAEGYLKICEKVQEGCFAFERFNDSERILVAVNLSGKDAAFLIHGKDLVTDKAIIGEIAIKNNSFLIAKYGNL